jgi:uncharacterized glyoxalase superfamily protein PhnB
VSDDAATATVEVPLAPDAAFAAFTDEIDMWWVRGPINFFDSSRAIAMRIEPGVGGRVLEVYDDKDGNALELGEITVWEPGARLTYRSLVDDTEVDVRFDAVEGGTRVRVTQTLLPGGTRALSFWPTVLRWFGEWCAQPEEARDGRRELALLSIALYYTDPTRAARWLADVFGFESWSGLPADGDAAEWIELHHGNVAIILFRLDGALAGDAPISHMPWAYVGDLDAHFAHVEAAGAAIVSPIQERGFRSYAASDLEGRRWTFVQARPTMR